MAHVKRNARNLIIFFVVVAAFVFTVCQNDPSLFNESNEMKASSVTVFH